MGFINSIFKNITIPWNRNSINRDPIKQILKEINELDFKLKSLKTNRFL